LKYRKITGNIEFPSADVHRSHVTPVLFQWRQWWWRCDYGTIERMIVIMAIAAAEVEIGYDKRWVIVVERAMCVCVCVRARACARAREG
jgi:hypothetical protein